MKNKHRIPKGLFIFSLVFSQACLAGALIGDAIKAWGKTTAVKESDNAHRGIKEAVLIDKDLEEKSPGAVRHVAKEAEKLGNKASKETSIALSDVETTLPTGKCGGDICDTLAKAADETIKEGERGLKSLEEKAEAYTKTPKKISTKGGSIDSSRQKNSDTASASFVCTKGKMVRKIVVEAPSKHPGYACRVVYESAKGTSVPWSAKNDEGYCRLKAVNFVARQIGWGWSCVRQ